MVASANRDPSVFPDPDRFDPARDCAKALTYGRGVHHCLGVHLAKMQMTTLLPLVRRTFPHLTLAGEPRWAPPVPVRCIEHLPAVLDGSG